MKTKRKSQSKGEKSQNRLLHRHAGRQFNEALKIADLLMESYIPFAMSLENEDPIGLFLTLTIKAPSYQIVKLLNLIREHRRRFS